MDPNWDERQKLEGKNGNNALHLAVGKPDGPGRVQLKGDGLRKLIDVLLKAGCSPWAMNAKGRAQPLHLNLLILLCDALRFCMSPLVFLDRIRICKS